MLSSCNVTLYQGIEQWNKTNKQKRKSRYTSESSYYTISGNGILNCAMTYNLGHLKLGY